MFKMMLCIDWPYTYYYIYISIFMGRVPVVLNLLFVSKSSERLLNAIIQLKLYFLDKKKLKKLHIS